MQPNKIRMLKLQRLMKKSNKKAMRFTKKKKKEKSSDVILMILIYFQKEYKFQKIEKLKELKTNEI